MKPTIGVCYYPEHWPEDMWENDAERMADAGIKWVRIGEFAWSRIEPSEGQFKWEWLDRAVQVLADAGLKIIMGTPTATPPRWVVDKYPDMICLDEIGHPRKFGSRRHYCFSHQGYRTQCAIIVDLMAKRYGGHPSVLSWQTDNEYGCHDTTLSYGTSAAFEFRNWLSQKYQSPDALNRAWGNIFWSMEYSDFSQIAPPNLTVTEPNPSHVMDFRRFSSDQVVSFNKLQVDIIRKYSDAPLVHNYMGRITDFDHYDVGSDLEIASWDSYPLGHLEMKTTADDAFKADYYQQGEPDFQAFHHDLYRAVGNGRLWIMEQQPGPVNWAHYNPAPLEGMVRLWSLEAVAHGAESVNYFRWRQAPFAQEQMHAGLLRPDNQDDQGMVEARQFKADLDALGDIEQIKAPVALVFDYASQWAWEVQPQGKSFDYFEIVFQTYKSLRALGVDVDIIAPHQADLSGYKVIFAPALFTLDDAFKASLDAFGGVVFAGPRFNSKTDNFHIPNELAPNIAHMDIKVSCIETVGPYINRDLVNGGAIINWIEKLETSEICIEKSIDQQPVLIRKDNWFYCGAWLDDIARERIFKTVLDELKIEHENLPEGIRIRTTKDQVFVFNYSNKDVDYHGQTIPAAGTIWFT